eukprot:5555164-Lingulodinium_polyedra.AAC.1
MDGMRLPGFGMPFLPSSAGGLSLPESAGGLAPSGGCYAALAWATPLVCSSGPWDTTPSWRSHKAP